MGSNAEADDGAVVLAEVDERFHVRDERTASWVVRKVAEERAYRQRVADWYEAEMRRSQRREQFLLYRFGGELENWAREQLQKQHGRRRSIHLPGGIIGFRTEPTKVMVNDAPRLISWCRAHLPSAVRTMESVLKTEIGTYVKQSGEVPDGAELAGGGEKFYIK